MSVIGHGLDVVEVEYFRKICADPSSIDTLLLYFTPSELALVGSGPDRAQRFAAKEAVLKALGVGWARDTAWTDVEIGALPSGSSPDCCVNCLW